MKRLFKIGGILLLTISLVMGIGFSKQASLVVAKKNEPITTSETETPSKQQETINEDISESEEVVYEEPVTDIVYTTASLNVRKEPNASSKRVSVLEPNSELTRVEDNDEWDAIEVAGVKYYVCDKYLTSTKPETIKKVTELKPIVETSAPAKTQYTSGQAGGYIGKFQLTAYCACSKCCGKWAGGSTASGTTPTQGRTVACNSLPFGTKILINGNVYVVEDTGNMANNVIDVFFNSHQEALNFGRKHNVDVYYAD